MLPYLRQEWGNPSSLYAPARRAAGAVQQARKQIANIFRCLPEEVVFTGSGSEGANLAIKGVAFAAAKQGRNHLVTSKVEHHAVLDTCRWLAAHFGFTLTEIDVDAHGSIDLQHLERSLTERTALVSIMYANNEVGTIQPLQEVVRLAHARRVPVHTDAVQAAGALSLDVAQLNVDLLSIAAHKFYGPKGVGALYIKRGTRLLPQTQGGGQERGRRSGTENVAGIVGIALALELAQTRPDLWPMTDRLLLELPQRVPGCQVTGHPTRRLPYHASFVFEGIEIAPVLLGLDKLDIWASSGSACTSQSSEPSHVLQAMGIPRASIFGALRLTLGLDNTPADIDALLESIPPLVARARQARAVAA
jgi:cysteine desulfurase